MDTESICSHKWEDGNGRNFMVAISQNSLIHIWVLCQKLYSIPLSKLLLMIHHSQLVEVFFQFCCKLWNGNFMTCRRACYSVMRVFCWERPWVSLHILASCAKNARPWLLFIQTVSQGSEPPWDELRPPPKERACFCLL